MTLPDTLYIEGEKYRKMQPHSGGALPTDKFFVRVLHELELADNLPHTTPPSRPEVRPFFPNHHVDFGKGHQLLSKEMNPLCTPNNWTNGYDFRLWATNNQGFGMDGSGDRPLDPRANFVTGEDLTSDLPKVEALTCGGNLLSVIGETRTKTNREFEDCYVVEALDWKQSAPTLEWIQARPWLITTAVNMGRDGTPRRFEQGKQPNGFIPGFFHPLLADPSRFQVCIPKWRVVEWQERTPPDPYTVYL